MKRAQRCALALLLGFSPLPAHAGSLNLRWNACFGDGGAVNRSFACDSNDGQQVLVGSFILPAVMKNVSGVEVTLDVVVAGNVLPAWWQVKNRGTCREGALTYVTDLPATAEHCTDWASGQAVGGFAGYKPGAFGANSARIIGVSAVPPQGYGDLAAGTEYFAFMLVLRNTKSVGKTACDGCRLGACIGLRSIKVTTPVAANDRTLVPDPSAKDATTDRRATWQGGAGVVIPPGREKLECSFSWRDAGSPLERLLALY